MRIAAIADNHCTRASRGVFKALFSAANAAADAIALAGDLTDYGLAEEAQVLAGELAAVSVPVIAVLGNHDHESGMHEAVSEILADAGVHMLDGDAVEINGVGFAGTKGFAGGFGRAALGAWGEAPIKAFVAAAIDEAVKLESALAQLRTERRVALLHYSPIRATVEGEPPELFAWLGSSGLEDPIDRYGASLVLHGHAHTGALEGRTQGGVPVYNVARSLLCARGYESGVRIIEL
ncbi:MAG TPA: metallophosphoesterase [Gammaproteobacteria bacterium]|nr:metallophosphoesterase [Gammaproteobacteria bacterium]